MTKSSLMFTICACNQMQVLDNLYSVTKIVTNQLVIRSFSSFPLCQLVKFKGF